jgi:hypothetical protein
MTGYLPESLKMFVEKGFDGLSMQKLAKTAGDSRIYKWNVDLEDFYVRNYAKKEGKLATIAKIEPAREI